MVEQPNFYDERTVLSAQPVVPLVQIKHRRRWILGGAFAIAMFLGAASALISAYFKLRNAPDPEIQTLSVLSVPEDTLEPQVWEVMQERPKPRVRNMDHTDRMTVQPRPVNQPRVNEEDELRRIRDAVLVQEWQERRARRVERRERRRAAQYRDRDLSNINEIFEGPHRP